MQPDAAHELETENAKRHGREIEAVVAFPLSGRGRYEHEFRADTSASVVRADAMAYFAVADDSTTVYYLTSHGERVAEHVTLGELAGSAESVRLTLAKELIQG
jgi:hypothetical protein